MNRASTAARNTQRYLSNQVTERQPVANELRAAADKCLAIIQSGGPGGAADYTGPQYWVLRQSPSPFANTSTFSGQATYSNDGVGTEVLSTINSPVVLSSAAIEPYWFTVTNLSELSAGTHTLAVGTIVEARAYVDPSNPSKRWYVINAGSATDTNIGEIQYQVRTMVSDNQAGWDFVRAHPLP